MRIDKKTAVPFALAAAVLAFVACGSDKEAVDQTSSAQKKGAENALVEAGTQTLEAGTAASSDAGADGDAAVAVVVPNPGKITCGASECVVEAEACCISGDSGICEEMGGACHSNGPNRARLECDEAADCKEGEVCVYFEDSEGVSSECRSGSGDREVLACKTDGECGAGGGCKLRPCFDGRSIRSCGPLGDVCP